MPSTLIPGAAVIVVPLILRISSTMPAGAGGSIQSASTSRVSVVSPELNGTGPVRFSETPSTPPVSVIPNATGPAVTVGAQAAS